MKYKYVSTRHYYRLRLYNFPSAGPGANVAGVRKQYWGNEALIIKCGSYIYKVDAETFYRV